MGWDTYCSQNKWGFENHMEQPWSNAHLQSYKAFVIFGTLLWFRLPLLSATIIWLLSIPSVYKWKTNNFLSATIMWLLSIPSVYEWKTNNFRIIFLFRTLQSFVKAKINFNCPWNDKVATRPKKNYNQTAKNYSSCLFTSLFKEKPRLFHVASSSTPRRNAAYVSEPARVRF